VARKRKRKTIWTNDAERAAWDAHVDETVAELRRLASEGRARLGIPEPADTVAFLRELAAGGGRAA
jgi:hypothetical protein